MDSYMGNAIGRIGCKLQVSEPVVARVPVTVVNYFLRVQFPSDGLGHNDSVEIPISMAIAQIPILTAFYASLPMPVTSASGILVVAFL